VALFGKSGRVWLGELELPGDERQTVKRQRKLSVDEH
jgi:hypothetical protein